MEADMEADAIDVEVRSELAILGGLQSRGTMQQLMLVTFIEIICSVLAHVFYVVWHVYMEHSIEWHAAA